MSWQLRAGGGARRNSGWGERDQLSQGGDTRRAQDTPQRAPEEAAGDLKEDEAREPGRVDAEEVRRQGGHLRRLVDGDQQALHDRPEGVGRDEREDAADDAALHEQAHLVVQLRAHRLAGERLERVDEAVLDREGRQVASEVGRRHAGHLRDAQVAARPRDVVPAAQRWKGGSM